MRSVKYTAVLLGGAAAAAVLAGGAYAQDVQPREATAQLEEVVITARRREERLQDVPVAVTALGEARLEELRVTEVADLAGLAPSLTITSAGFGYGRAAPSFSIRGLTSQEQSILTDPAVTLYFNDVPLPRPQGLNLALFDVATVEVLKGPQGTLFGRNVTGGAILIRPNRPADELQADAGFSYSRFNTLQLQGMLNLPVGGAAALRLAAQFERSDGYLRDAALGGRHYDGTNHKALRVGLDLHPGDRFSSLTFVNYAEASDGGTGYKLVDIDPTSPFNAAGTRGALNYQQSYQQLLQTAQSQGFYELNSGVIAFSKTKVASVDNTTTFELSDSLSLKNIASYRTLKSNSYDDYDGMPYMILPINFTLDHEQYTEELQLQYSNDALSLVAGAFYFQEKGSYQSLSVSGGPFRGLPEADLSTIASRTYTAGRGDNRSYAVFGEGTVKLDRFVQGLALTAGIRQSWDSREGTILSRSATICRFTVDDDNNPATPEVRPALSACSLPVKAEFSEPTYNVSLQYNLTPEKMVYLAHRHGYRSGGFSLRGSSQASLGLPFKPEKVDDIELGLKTEWRAGGAFVRFNAAAYLSEYSNIQRLQVVPNLLPVQSVTTNAAKARIIGFEPELTIVPMPGVELTAFYAYTDAQYQEFLSLAGADLSDRPFALTPKHTFGLTGRVTLPMEIFGGETTLGARYTYSSSYSDFDEPDGFSIIDSNGLLSADIGWRSGGDNAVAITLFADNLLNEKYFQPGYHNRTLGFSSRNPGEPLQVGLRVNYSLR